MEEEIQRIGRKLLEYSREEEGRLASKHRWENTLLDWCMDHPELRLRAFRFIDVFPQLRSAHSVVQHIQEYFPASEHRLPAAIRWGLGLSRPSLLTRGMIHLLTKIMFQKIACLFVAASDERQALQIVERLDKQGIRSSIDLLGEKTLSEEEANGYLLRYRTLIETLGRKKMGLDKQNVSVKLSALDPLFDPIQPETASKRLRHRLRELVRLARQNNVFLHIDMEEYAIRDLTLKTVRDLLEEPEFQRQISLGIVLQAYHKDARQCLDSILQWPLSENAPLVIRLVRGAYWDQEIMEAREKNWPIPVFTSKHDTDACFEELTARILEAQPRVKLALATHNIRSIAYALSLIQQRNVASHLYEFQLLYGMGDPLAYALRRMGHSPRLYLPIGDPVLGMAYLVRRLLENVSNQSFVRRGIHKKADPEELLRPPSPQASPEPEEKISQHRWAPLPPLRFFDHEVRLKAAASVSAVKTELGRQIPLVIGGKSRQTMERIHTVSPNDGQTRIVDAARASISDALDAITAAEKAFRNWARLPVTKRSECLRKAARWMEKNRFELAAIQLHEVGKPYREADADVKEAVDFLNFYADTAERLVSEHPTEMLPNERNYVIPHPRGVTVVIAPWNFPMAILTGMSAAALVTGNTVVLKPAEQSLLCAWKVFEAYRRGGLPEGVLHFLPGYGHEIGPTLVEDPRVAVVAFTGSKEVGCHIAERLNRRSSKQRHMKKYLLEMGGKNAVIVDETADLDQAIPAILHSAFTYAGQKCSALSRLIVVESIYQDLLNRLIPAARSFPVGHPENFEVRCGPVIEKQAQERILGLVEEGKRSGTLLFQATLPKLPSGYYVPPVILADLPEDSPLLREEIFGPVLAVLRAKNFDDALRLANATDYALTGGVFTRTLSHLEKAKREFEVGNLYLNRAITGAIVGRHPFGGYRMSGTGTKAGGENYLREFCMEQTISENLIRHGFASLDPLE